MALPLMAGTYASDISAGGSLLDQYPQGRRGRGGSGGSMNWSEERIKALNIPYDGRFIFARIKFTPSSSGYGYRSDVKWDHDYPRAERNFTRIIEEITNIEPYLAGGNIINIGEGELCKYPWAYLCEPGYWTMTDEEAENLRQYLFKGGFVVFDDFFRDDWYNFARRMRELLPGYDLVRLDESHPIFHTFFDIDDLSTLGTMNRYGAMPSFYGVYEDNDPNKRLLLIVNYDTDIGDYWEWSDMGYVPIDLSNEAYKLGINYIIYSMTH
jgi:hypothetical protein